MPTYVYQAYDEQGQPVPGSVFEVVQPMSEDALTSHPETGQPVKRIPQAPNLPAMYTERQQASRLSDENLGKHGFTKYVRQSGGDYVKTVGEGPAVVNKDDY